MALPGLLGITVPSVDDCSRTAPLPAPLRGGWNGSESVAGVRRNHRLEWIGIAGCFASEYADMAGCRLFARGSDPGHSFSAAGSRRFVATAAAVDAIGSAISSGIRQSADYDDCMLMRG